MKIPVILLNYNSSSDCRKCIGFLRRQEGVELEIIVVDNCSPREGEQEAIKALCQEQVCTFIQSSENRGYNAGNNIGLRYAAEKGYKYALIANPDMEFPQVDYISRLVDAMEKDPEIVVCGSDILGSDGTHQSPMKRDGNWRESFGWVKGLFKNKKVDIYYFIDNYTENHYCSKVSGCCFLVRLDFVKSIGYFDENVFLYCEEAILSRQVEQHNMHMYYLADIQAVHAHVKSEKGDPVVRFKHWKKSRLYFIDRYSGDSWIGRKIASFSMSLYVLVYTILKKCCS